MDIIKKKRSERQAALAESPLRENINASAWTCSRAVGHFTLTLNRNVNIFILNGRKQKLKSCTTWSRLQGWQTVESEFKCKLVNLQLCFLYYAMHFLMGWSFATLYILNNILKMSMAFHSPTNNMESNSLEFNTS